MTQSFLLLGVHLEQQTLPLNWIPPPSSWIKISSDANSNPWKADGATSWVARNPNGYLLGSGFVLEALEIKDEIRWAVSNVMLSWKMTTPTSSSFSKLKRGIMFSKSLIKITKARLEASRKKKKVVANYLKNDIADLLKTGFHSNAYSRTQGLIFELNLIATYKFVEDFCDCISTNLAVLDKQKYAYQFEFLILLFLFQLSCLFFVLNFNFLFFVSMG
ncbi:hypothetical protein LINGRAHAP2_LOCUS7338 [Linum grandiflorum]